MNNESIVYDGCMKRAAKWLDDLVKTEAQKPLKSRRKSGFVMNPWVMLLSAWEKGHINATINNVKACFISNNVFEWVIEDEVASRLKNMQTPKKMKKHKVKFSKEEPQFSLF
jgi:hypothetical protein